MAWQQHPSDDVEQPASNSTLFWPLVGVVLVVVLLVGLCGAVFVVGAFRIQGQGSPGPARPPIVVTPAYHPTVPVATATAASQP
jgi:hypothetical protein